jgi:GMP synthase (glutamine-hydrolysing)
MRILIIDNTIEPESWGSKDLRLMARVAEGATSQTRRAPHEDMPRHPRAIDRIVISGSKTDATANEPWINQLDDFLRRAVNENVPLLGVCYGHQSLARALGGYPHVRKAVRGEHGWAKIELLEAAQRSPLFKGMPRSFHSFQWHNDEVCELPPRAKLLARSENCPIQSFQLEDRPVFGIQFHPERGLPAAEKSIAKRRKDDPKAPILNPDSGQKLYDMKIGETIFKNFLLG